MIAVHCYEQLHTLPYAPFHSAADLPELASLLDQSEGMADARALASAQIHLFDQIDRLLLDRAGDIRCPMLLFFGDQDPFIPNEEVEKITATLRDLNKDAEVEVYPGAPHGFFCDQRDSYRADAAADAWNRLKTFFARHLKS